MAANNVTDSESATDNSGNRRDPGEFPRWKRVCFTFDDGSRHADVLSGFITTVNHHDFSCNALSYDITTVDSSGAAMLWKNCPASAVYELDHDHVLANRLPTSKTIAQSLPDHERSARRVHERARSWLAQSLDDGSVQRAFDANEPKPSSQALHTEAGTTYPQNRYEFSLAAERLDFRATLVSVEALRDIRLALDHEEHIDEHIDYENRSEDAGDNTTSVSPDPDTPLAHTYKLLEFLVHVCSVAANPDDSELTATGRLQNDPVLEPVNHKRGVLYRTWEHAYTQRQREIILRSGNPVEPMMDSLNALDRLEALMDVAITWNRWDLIHLLLEDLRDSYLTKYALHQRIKAEADAVTAFLGIDIPIDLCTLNKPYRKQ